MKAFNASEWNREAKRQREASLAAGRDPARVLKRYKEDVRFINKLKVLVKWCKDNSLNVVFKSTCLGSYDPDIQTVSLSYKLKPLNQLLVLLHEVGHYAIARWENNERFSLGYRNVNPTLDGSILNRLDILDEEFEAWARGWNLAMMLRLLKKEDRPAFDRMRADSLKEYLKWSMKVDKYNK